MIHFRHNTRLGDSAAGSGGGSGAGSGGGSGAGSGCGGGSGAGGRGGSGRGGSGAGDLRTKKIGSRLRQPMRQLG